MQNKLIINTLKCISYAGIVLILAFYSLTFNGCSGSDEEEVITQRDKDSVEVYSALQKAFAQYKSALNSNVSSDDKKANEEFEKSLVTLNRINYELITKGENYFWKKDYDELSKSIVEDYLTTQSEIVHNSLVFEFAKRIPVTYEKIEHVSNDKEPLPEGSDVPLIRNSVVDEYIEFFSNTERGRSFIDKSLYRSGKYFPLMRKILKYNNAPEELIYLSVQESGLNPTIVSRAGAVGMWQFMPATGISYGLGSDGYRDDRRDFEKATDAAAHLLKDLYRTFDDWYLAFAAYNAGPGRVNKAIRNSGSRDFWSLRGFLPGETKNYVPSILALSFVLRNPEEYGFKDIEYGEQISFDRVEIQTQLTLGKVAELCETDIETVRDLNPELTSDVVPFYDVPYELRIPHKSFDKFLANYNSDNQIDKSSGYSPSFAGNESGNYGSEITGVQYKVKNYEPEDIRAVGSTYGLKMIKHEFSFKDPLYVVASYYDVRTTDIRLWNNLNYGYIPDQKKELQIYVPESKYRLLNQGSNNNQSGYRKPEEKKLADDINKKQDVSLKNGTDTKPESEVKTVQKPKTEVTKESWPETEIKTESKPEVTVIPPSDTKPEETTETETVETVNQEPKTGEVETSDNSATETSGEVTENTGTDETESVAETVETEESYYEETAQVESNTSENKIPASNAKYYTVKSGDNLTRIANENNVTINDLKSWNNLKSEQINTGQKLIVGKASLNTSGKKKSYKVKKGDTLASISASNNVTVKELKSWNGLKSDKLLVGQVLKLYGDNHNKGKKK
ncbi:MAG: LysM peptidoglycan-binding domain-containing protein [Ignavibacteria bacterium]|nr:LysM peptidoglycan-binding domain-containing protein [Ignavibacteria bacterium]